MRKITVITINYNNLQGLKRTVPSVLSQSYDDFEYVIVDGGSTDGSKEYIEQQKFYQQYVDDYEKIMSRYGKITEHTIGLLNNILKFIYT